MTRLEKETEILSRPGFLKVDDSDKIKALIHRAINQAERQYYEANRLTSDYWEKITAPAGLTIPAGTTYGTGKLYKLTQSTTEPLPTDLQRIKKLWVFGTSGVVTYSSSTYDSDSSEGSGLPADSSASLSTSVVYHELIGKGSTQELNLFIGTTAQDTTPKLRFLYTRSLVPCAADGDSIDVPDFAILSTFEAMVNTWLQYYIGFST